MGVMTAGARIVLDVTPPVGSANRPFGDAAVPRGTPQGWDLLGTVPVPLRHRVRDGVADLVARYRAEGGSALKCCFPMGQGGRTPFDRLRFIRALDDYPNMLVSSEHGNAFNHRFYARHVADGAFVGSQPAGVVAAFAEAGLVDPEDRIGVFAVAPFVLLIDHGRLNGLPPPRRWADLMDPRYRDQVVFSGWRRDGERRHRQVNLFFLLSMARAFGLAGLARLLDNVPALLHSAQMPRLAGTDASPGGIYVLPWSLAALCPRRVDTEVVWPEDGALAYPLWLTVKTAHRERLNVLVRHFHGADLGRVLNDNRYPALCPDLTPALPAGARLSWLGWDFVRHPTTARLLRAIREIFADQEDRLCA
jgi:ABC-type Fe3+ transport system substrate-binding protein